MARRSSRRRRRAPSWPIRAAALAAALSVVAAALWFVLARGGPKALADGGGVEFGDRIRAVADARGVPSVAIRADDPIRKVDGVFVRTWRIELPSADQAGALLDLLAREAERAGATVRRADAVGAGADLRVDLGREAFEIVVEVAVGHRESAVAVRPRPSPTLRPAPAPDATGRLAILLDDGGQSLDLVPAAVALPDEVAVAVLPFLPASVETAVAVHRGGHEVWLHLPMEPEDYPQRSPGPGAVLMSMTESEIRTTVHAALNNLPHVVGVNNHMGSRATADLPTMTWVMQELKARGVAFLDSRTTVDTVAEAAARAQGVATARRHVFLDNERTPVAVRAQLAEAVYRALLEGEAVAIGHLDPVTVQVLASELPGLQDRGITLVRPSDAVR